MPKPRKQSNKSVLPVLHIYCEGEKTEPNYLKGYINKFYPGSRRYKVVEIEETKKNTPVQLVTEATIRKKDRSTPRDDEFWVVYDRESVAKYSDALHSKAYNKATSNAINVALTNVCFEVWILLHLIESNACYSSYDDLRSRSPLRSELRKRGIADYDKSDTTIFDAISRDIETAKKRAERMNQATLTSSFDTENAPYKLNPYTKVHALLDAIDDFLKSPTDVP